MHRRSLKACLPEHNGGGDPLVSRKSKMLERSRPGALRGMQRHKFSWLMADGLTQKYQCSFTNCIKAANYSAAGLVNLLADDFPCFNDAARYENRKSVRFLKRAQICVADIWAAFDGKSYGEFDDIDKLTIFADYRVPQILNTLGCLWYSPLLQSTINAKKAIESGHPWEIQLRGQFHALSQEPR